MRRLVVARHGNTFKAGEPLRRIGSHTDLRLTDEGQEQARRLGAAFRLAGFRFASALTGPLMRARLTAELILSEMAGQTPLSVVPSLNEIDYGPDEGQLEATIMARVGPAALARWDAEGLAAPGWIVNRDERMGWWQRLLAGPPPGDTLLVTSNGSARYALLALGSRALPTSLKLRTGAFGVLRHAGTAGWIVDSWDDRPEEPPHSNPTR